jgi:hypothetical protein
MSRRLAKKQIAFTVGSTEIRLVNEALFLASDDSSFVIGVEPFAEDGRRRSEQRQGRIAYVRLHREPAGS